MRLFIKELLFNTSETFKLFRKLVFLQIDGKRCWIFLWSRPSLTERTLSLAAYRSFALLNITSQVSSFCSDRLEQLLEFRIVFLKSRNAGQQILHLCVERLGGFLHQKLFSQEGKFCVQLAHLKRRKIKQKRDINKICCTSRLKGPVILYMDYMQYTYCTYIWNGCDYMCTCSTRPLYFGTNFVSLQILLIYEIIEFSRMIMRLGKCSNSTN